MDNEDAGTATVICVGGSTMGVRGVCARVKESGYRAIAVITDVNPECTLPLLATLSADAIIVSDDLPASNGTVFTESLQRLYPDVRILLMAEDHDASRTVSTLSPLRPSEVMEKLSALFKANA
jgi:DNA-binding NarL/FixJ family response regulator